MARNEDGFGYDLRKVRAENKDATIRALAKQAMIYLAAHQERVALRKLQA